MSALASTAAAQGAAQASIDAVAQMKPAIKASLAKARQLKLSDGLGELVCPLFALMELGREPNFIRNRNALREVLEGMASSVIHALEQMRCGDPTIDDALDAIRYRLFNLQAFAGQFLDCMDPSDLDPRNIEGETALLCIRLLAVEIVRAFNKALPACGAEGYEIGFNAYL